MKSSNRIRLHRMFHRGIVLSGQQGMYNAIVIKNPFDFIDCSVEENFTSFQYFIKDGILLYAEVCNSVPLGSDGHSIGNFGLLSHRECRSRVVFSDDDIVRLSNEISGTGVYVSGIYDERYKCGEFVDGWTWRENVNGVHIRNLCGLVWLDREKFHDCYFNYDANAHLAFNMEVDSMTCCECGYTIGADANALKEGCEHMRCSGRIVCKFKRIVGFYMLQ